MHPVFTQVPPNLWRSIMATVLPALANRAARDGPAWPVPIMIASKCFIARPGLCLRSDSCRPPLPVQESCRPDAPQCKRRTNLTSDASELWVRIHHGAFLPLAAARPGSRHLDCSVLDRAAGL